MGSGAHTLNVLPTTKSSIKLCKYTLPYYMQRNKSLGNATMATPKKKPNPAGLIAIANPTLAQKLDKSAEAEELAQSTASPSDDNQAKHSTFNQDIWKAVFALNILRYGLSLCLLALIVLQSTSINTDLLNSVSHPALFKYSVIALLMSAVCFTLFTLAKKFPLAVILLTQFTIDILLTGALVHASGGIKSNFTLLFLIVVTTGSVVLRRKHAIALASGATITLFYEHFYSLVNEEIGSQAQFDTLAIYCLLLIGAGSAISYLAQRLRAAELKSFNPGDESIEDYLVREEKAALKSALHATDGNKTEAAKLLGMTFRSFRYKLTKYDMG